MARTVAAPKNVAELLAAIAAAMLADGWNNDGAPTATILVGAADTEGRRPYISLEESSGDVLMRVGTGRSGDTITNPGTFGAAEAIAEFGTTVYQIFTTEHCLSVVWCRIDYNPKMSIGTVNTVNQTEMDGKVFKGLYGGPIIFPFCVVLLQFILQGECAIDVL